MIKRKFSIKQVVNKTGLEESEIRFYEQTFKDFLTFTSMELDRNEFNEDHIGILIHIQDLIRKRGFSLEEVKRELKRTTKSFGGNQGRNRSGRGGRPIDLPPPKPLGYARVIAFTSGKGGVGKTTLAANVAATFAQMGRKVAIFDADLGLANIHILMGVKPRFNLVHLIQDGFSLEDIIAVGPLGIKVISGGQGVREMANLDDEQRRILLREMDKLEREVDILIVDTGAGISDNVLRFASFADEVVVVTTPNIAAAADAFSIIKILLEMDPNSKIGLVGNMVDNMYHSKNVFNRINTAVEKYLRYALGDLGYVLNDNYMKAANQIRKPLMLAYPESPSARCIREIVNTLMHEKMFSNTKPESSFGEIMGALKRTMVGV